MTLMWNTPFDITLFKKDPNEKGIPKYKLGVAFGLSEPIKDYLFVYGKYPYHEKFGRCKQINETNIYLFIKNILIK